VPGFLIRAFDQDGRGVLGYDCLGAGQLTGTPAVVSQFTQGYGSHFYLRSPASLELATTALIDILQLHDNSNTRLLEMSREIDTLKPRTGLKNENSWRRRECLST